MFEPGSPMKAIETFKSIYDFVIVWTGVANEGNWNKQQPFFFRQFSWFEPGSPMKAINYCLNQDFQDETSDYFGFYPVNPVNLVNPDSDNKGPMKAQA